MQLKEVQAIYYLLNVIQFEESEKISFDLYVDYNGKLITAKFLPMNNDKTQPREMVLNNKYEKIDQPIGLNYLKNLFSHWEKQYKPENFNCEKAFSEPVLLLDHFKTFLENTDYYIPPMIQRVQDLHYVESDIIFDQALLYDDGYRLISLVVKDN